MGHSSFDNMVLELAEKISDETDVRIAEMAIKQKLKDAGVKADMKITILNFKEI